MAEPDSLRVWALLGERTGDNAQVLALARALSAHAAEKRLRFNRLYLLPNRLLGASLLSLDRAASEPLDPPWPDVSIAIGRRSAPVQRWIKERSGGRTVTVQIGRPRAPLSWFDLVVTTPQYGLPDDPNVMTLPLPLVALRQEGGEGRLAGLARPVVGLLVGGGRFPFRLDEVAARALVRRAGERVRALGGSLAVSTSPRTGDAAARAMADGLAVPGFVYRWGEGGDNPHRAILSTADRFIVTEDSVSMIAEAVLTGRPVEIAPLPRFGLVPRWSGREGLFATLARQGLLSPPRDVRAFCRGLIAAGHACWLGGEGECRPAADPLPAVALRVRALVAASAQRAGHR